MKKLVSIIVPVYNVQLYIDRCMNSIVNQTYRNIEIILVNDGSTDHSGQLCDNWTYKDARVKVIHKDNGGLVSARKSGITVAHGEYVCVVDSDDWIDNNMVEKLLYIAEEENVDVVSSLFCNENTFEADSKNEFKVGRYDCINDGYSFYSRMIYRDNENMTLMLSGSMCGKIFKRELLKSCQLSVDDRISFGEDGACVWDYFLHANSVYISDMTFYHYERRSDSISGSEDKYYWAKINYFYVYVRDIFQKHRYADVLLKQLDKYIVECRYFPGLERVVPSKKMMQQYTVPYEIIPVGSRIVLYGAGNVGKSFYTQLINSDFCYIDAWVDKRYKRYQDIGVISIKELETRKYDFILIATTNEKVKSEMMEEIVLSLHCDREKILWKKPKTTKFFMMVDC